MAEKNKGKHVFFLGIMVFLGIMIPSWYLMRMSVKALMHVDIIFDCMDYVLLFKASPWDWTTSFFKLLIHILIMSSMVIIIQDNKSVCAGILVYPLWYSVLPHFLHTVGMLLQIPPQARQWNICQAPTTCKFSCWCYNEGIWRLHLKSLVKTGPQL